MNDIDYILDPNCEVDYLFFDFLFLGLSVLSVWGWCKAYWYTELFVTVYLIDSLNECYLGETYVAIGIYLKEVLIKFILAGLSNVLLSCSVTTC